MKKSILISLVSALCLSGCVTNDNFFHATQDAKIAGKTSNYLELRALPKPKGAIPVSVYSFRDQTGQYKPSSTVSSFSTAVSQGATAMLTQTLSETSWFIPVEREGLQNLLTERKIIRAASEHEKGTTNDDLPPLMTSSIILEGGITGYESNTKTGGLGVGYFGYTTSGLYRQDDVTVYLRAVDVRTGRVLLSVSTKKSIYSEEIRAGLFRYMTLTRLAEFEAGYTTNEPVQVCLLQAIQKAVSDLVLEGIDRGIWQVASPAELESQLLADYRLEKSGLLAKLAKEKTKKDEEEQEQRELENQEEPRPNQVISPDWDEDDDYW